MLTVAEAATFLCKSRGGVYHWIRMGVFPVNRSRRPVRIAMVAIKAFLSAEHSAWNQLESRQAAQQRCGDAQP